MPNHFHFLLKQLEEGGITKLMRAITTAYAMYFNKKYNRVGPLFQGRFKAKLVEGDEYFLQLSKYIHRNPLPLMGERPVLSSYPHSSYSLYLGTAPNQPMKTACNTGLVSSYFSTKNPILSYQSFVEESEPDLERLKEVLFDEDEE